MDDCECITERKLIIFEHKILWRMMCRLKLDTNTGIRRRKFNKELRWEKGLAPIKCYMRGQRIQRFDHVVRGNDEFIIKAVMSWKPTGKASRGRPRI